MFIVINNRCKMSYNGSCRIESKVTPGASLRWLAGDDMDVHVHEEKNSLKAGHKVEHLSSPVSLLVDVESAGER